MSDTTSTPAPDVGAIVANAAEALEAGTEPTIEATGGEETPAAEAAPAAEPTPEPAKPDQFGAKFAALSRKEKQIRDARKQFEAERAAWAAEKATAEAETAKYKSLPERMKKEPLKVMEEHGLTFQQLAEMMLNDGKPTTDMVMSERDEKIQKQLKDLQDKIEAKEKAETERKYEETLQNFVADLTEFVNTNEEYELIQANDGVQLVYQVIEDYYNEQLQTYIDEHGEDPDAETRKTFILSNKDACNAVEEHLLSEAKKHLELKKIKKLTQPTTPPAEATAPKKTAAPTLSNAQAAQAPSKGQRKLSDEESRREAAKLIKWNT